MSCNYHCSLLNGSLPKETSTIYGITHNSPLNELSNFHVVDQLPQEVMHILLEGVVPYELSLMLASFIDQKYLVVELFNDRITCFAYSTQEAKNIPSPIKPRLFTSHGVSQPTCNPLYLYIAAQMWALAINLPLMIGDQIPQDNEKWECFLMLLDILQLCIPSREDLQKMHYNYGTALCGTLSSADNKVHFSFVIKS